MSGRYSVTDFDTAARSPLSLMVTQVRKQFILLATLAVSIAATSIAEARPKNGNHHRQPAEQAVIVCDMRGCSDNLSLAGKTKRKIASNRFEELRAQRQRSTVKKTQTMHVCSAQGCSDTVADPTARHINSVDGNGNSAVIGSRPAGCPHRFCGCEASLYVFGEIRKDLNLAATWARKFPRTLPSPGMVAARSGHVMVLMSHAGGDDWVVHDGNSGGGRTREHVRSIRGYTIVNPHATVTAGR